MKTLVAIILASTLFACATTTVKAVHYSVDEPCMQTLVAAMYEESEDKLAGVGITSVTALTQAGFTSIDEPLLNELGTVCAANPDTSFLQAAQLMQETRNINHVLIEEEPLPSSTTQQ